LEVEKEKQVAVLSTCLCCDEAECPSCFECLEKIPRHLSLLHSHPSVHSLHRQHLLSVVAEREKFQLESELGTETGISEEPGDREESSLSSSFNSVDFLGGGGLKKG